MVDQANSGCGRVLAAELVAARQQIAGTKGFEAAQGKGAN